MAIENMKRLRLAAVKRDREELLKKLMLLGCVEINEPEGILANEALAGLLDKGISAYGESKSDYESLNLALELLYAYAPEKTKILAPKPEIHIGDILNEDSLEKTLAQARELIKKGEDIRSMQAEESRIRSACQALEPWLHLDLPLEVSETKSCFVSLGGIPSVTDMAQFKTELYDLAYGIQLFGISKDRDMNYILVLAMKQDKSEVSSFLASRGFMESTAKNEYEGTAAENMDTLKKRLSQLEQKRQALHKEITSAAFLREDFKLCADRLMTKVGAEENSEKLLHTEETVIFEGWFPAKREQELIKIIESLGGAWEIREPLEEEYPEVPVKLTNGRFSRPLNMVTNMYSLPMYGSVDPNPRMAFFFILFYGIMMADMAYGLLMILASVIVLKKKRPAEGMRNFFELMFECGISTVFWGALTGSFFGDTPYQIVKIINPDTSFQGLPALFSPIDNTIEILLAAMVLGFIHIIAGMAVNFAKKTRAGKLKDAIMDEGSWWLLFAGLIVGATTGFWWVAIAGLTALICTQGREKPTIVGKIVGGIASLYDITAYVGDILSYSRLMALMLAGSVIGQIFNTIGAIPGNLIVYFVVFALGHTLNFGLNLLGCYVHDLRLQCLEFFGKFYEDGGREFKPLKVNTKYYDVTVK